MSFLYNTPMQKGIFKPALNLLISIGFMCLLGFVSLALAEVRLCGNAIEPDPDGVYRLRGRLTCSNNPILFIDEEYAKFDLKCFTATGDTQNTGIEIAADNVTIGGGHFRRCYTALNINRRNNCVVKNFIATDSTDKAIKIRGDNNSIKRSFCKNAGNDCFELRAEADEKNNAEWCTAINSGTPEEEAQGFSIRGPATIYKCSAIGSTAEGFQIQEGIQGVTIRKCLSINNAMGGIVIKIGATGNTVEHNIAFANGDGADYFDLIDENGNCEQNTWERNKSYTKKPKCIK